MSDTLLRVEDLKIYYPVAGSGFGKKEFVKAVDGVTFEVKKGEVFGIVGESGCGKSTLGRGVCKLENLTSGHVYLDGEDITEYNDRRMRSIRKKVQMVFQDPYASLNPRMSVFDIIAEPLLVHDQFGDKYPIPANNGKTIEFRKYESLPKATEPLTEGVTPNAQALTVTPMTATVKQYGGWAAITDVLQLTAIDNNITQATKVLASQAGRTLDTVTREVLAGGTNVIYAPAGDTAVTSRANLTTASVLTPDLIDQAATALKAQNADAIGESYVAIVHPYVAYDLRRNPEWIDVHKYAAPENIYNGEIGKLALSLIHI